MKDELFLLKDHVASTVVNAVPNTVPYLKTIPYFSVFLFMKLGIPLFLMSKFMISNGWFCDYSVYSDCLHGLIR